MTGHALPWVDQQHIAVAFEHEVGYRIGFMVFGDGENSPTRETRLLTVRSRGFAAVGDPAQIELAL
jgi:hypothetical protein